MRTLGMAFLVLTFTSFNSFAESESGSVCVAPSPATADSGSPDGIYCESGKLTFAIDKQQAVPWPAQGSVEIGDISVSSRHRIVVLCNGKALQSFSFDYSEFKTKALCLFINGFYRTVQLWEVKGSPWCKCKNASEKR